MSLKSYSTLEVTGNILEIPPPKESTPIRVADKVKSKPINQNNLASIKPASKNIASRNQRPISDSADSTKKGANEHRICQV
jgi:hypothetical protein